MRRLLILLFVMSVASVSAPSENLTGTRPGEEGTPLRVDTTLVLLDVSKIDGADQSFTADVFMMLRWKDDRLAADIKGVRRQALDSIWNPRVQIINQRRLWKTFDEKVDIAPDGTVIYRQRFYGQFASPLNLRDFPLDRHRFALQVVIPGYLPAEIEMAPSTVGFKDIQSPTMTVPDWSIGSFLMRQNPYSIVPGGREIPGVEGFFEARRHLGFYVGKAFISVAIIVFMSWVVFWLSAENIGPRLSVAVTSMLTLIAYRFLLGQSLPPVSYLTRLDYFLLGATIMVFVALIQVALTSSMTEERAAGFNRFSRWAFPLAFVLLSRSLVRNGLITSTQTRLFPSFPMFAAQQK